MSLNLQIKQSDKFASASFVHVSFYQKLIVGELYRFLEYPNLNFIRQALCVSVKNLPLESIPETVCFLDKNCDKQIYLKIMSDQNIGLSSVVSIGTFTNPENSKKHYYASILD